MTVVRLRILLLVFFAALAIPGTVLIVQAYGQLKWETFHQHQQLAQALAQRIDANFSDLIRREENRAFTDYAFLNVSGSETNAFLQRSPLSNYPVDTDIEGLIGYFQVDAQGQLLTPTMPASNAIDYGIDPVELEQRIALEASIRNILSQNQLVKNKMNNAPAVATNQPSAANQLAESEQSKSGFSSYEAAAPAAESAAAFDQSAFDQLNSADIGRTRESSRATISAKVKDLKLDDKYQVAQQAEQKFKGEELSEKVKKLRKETTLLAELPPEASIKPENDLALLTGPGRPIDNLNSSARKQNALRIRTFETEVDSFELSLLGSGHLVLFRQVWNNNQRYVQGLLFDPDKFLNGLMQAAFSHSALSTTSRLIVAYQGNVLKTFEANKSRDYLSAQTVNDLLYQTRLVSPFSDMELLFSVSKLPLGTGAKIVSSSALILTLVLIAGFFMLYRLGVKQIALAEQQQNFVSAVSHELKTPLTSIRMYGEILRQGWVDEARKKTYYDFIFNESERLSRLINNVLQLARVTKNEQKANLTNIKLGNLLDDNLIKIKSQLEPAGFDLQLDISEEARNSSLNIDADWFTQIMINLVDNAIKFSSAADKKQLVVQARRMSNNTVLITLRDFGPGIAKDQMRKIFTLFYRSENELTRETVGTGIGLALVRQLVKGMDGEIGLVNCEPGVEFKLRFQCH
ncbi:MAG: signal transduction histidine kinase [Gammaproteobacteria bacterium]|jgi:signal transduction histidine kinase